MNRFEPPRAAGRSYHEIVRRFQWDIPVRFNAGAACVDRHPSKRLGLVYVPPAGEPRRFTFGDLRRLSNRVANTLLRGLGLTPGERVAVILPQRPEAALVHVGAFKAGLISLPLSPLFGPDALRHRLIDSGAAVAITDQAGAERLNEVEAPELRAIVLVDNGGAGGRRLAFWQLIGDASDDFPLPTTRSDEPCLLIYTSGTTGPAKGVLHAHRVLLGQAPGFVLCHEYPPKKGDLMWTPADWAWVGGLVNTLLLAWLYGLPMVAAPRRRFDPDWALQLMASQGVRNAFLPTTALRMMLQCKIPSGVRLRSMLAGGEPQEPELLEKTLATFGIPYNESYGQTEADFIVGHCGSRWPLKPGSMGRAYPGHDVRVMDANGEPARPGDVGEVAVRLPDPTALLEYWNQPSVTSEKRRGGWLRTGDLAHADEEDYLWFESRSDDVIKSAGYRIGPEEVEECLRRHEAVGNAAAVGAPDPIRGHVVKAYVQLRAGYNPSEQLSGELQAWVRQHLAAYQYPRAIEFIEALPLTATGKVSRSTLRRHAAEQAIAPATSP